MNFLTLLFIPVISLGIVLAIMPMFRKAAFRVNLVDKPSLRKKHVGQVPLVGGLAIWFATVATLVSSHPSILTLLPIRFILGAGTVLLVIGVIDDKADLRATIKLTIQIALAYFAFTNGFRIESLHGVMGIYELPLPLQYAITMIVITGVVNAFNLMDGIDGLASGLALVSFILFGMLAYKTGQTAYLYLFLALIGALIGFMRFNLSAKTKVFMGDAGSLFIGLVMVLSSISLLQAAQGTSDIQLVLSVVVGVLALPVLDSLRVYRRRAKNGFSPFRADRTHFHHLVLQLGLKNRYSTVFVLLVSLALIALSVVMGSIAGFTLMIITLLTVFISISWILGLNTKVNHWRAKVLEMEMESTKSGVN